MKNLIVMKKGSEKTGQTKISVPEEQVATWEKRGFTKTGEVQDISPKPAPEPQKPIVVPDSMDSEEANNKYGESYGEDWIYEGKPEES